MLCAVVAALTVCGATMQPWLALNLAHGDRALIVQSADAQGPALKDGSMVDG